MRTWMRAVSTVAVVAGVVSVNARGGAWAADAARTVPARHTHAGIIGVVHPDAGTVPPANPSVSLSPSPNFSGNGSCQGGVMDDSTGCDQSAIQAIDNARANPNVDGIGKLLLDSSVSSTALPAFQAMTVPQQLFVVANLERVDRGLPPVTGLTTQLDSVGQSGASAGGDPSLASSTLSGGALVVSWGSNWAGGTNNAIGTDYYLMYDDGYPGINGDCTSSYMR